MRKVSSITLVSGLKRPVPLEIDCKSVEGVTIGLIDSLMSISAILRIRLENEEVTDQIEEALEDLASDKDLAEVMLKANSAQVNL